MPVGPAKRDQFIEVVAAHMRGEIDGAEATLRLDALAAKSSDAQAEIRVLRDLYTLDRFGPCELEWPEGWENARRLLAFLMTDRPYPRAGDDWVAKVDPWARVRKQRLAQSLLAALAISALMIPWLGVLPLIGCWLLSAIVWMSASYEHHRPNDSSQCYWPFDTAEAWRASEPLLQGLALPAWERSVHYRPPPAPPSPWSRLWGWGGFAFLVFWLFWVVACTWPIVVWTEAFPRKNRRRVGPATT